MSSLRVVGVRHHSPACARLVERVIEGSRPRYVLIEGPSDMNDRIGELSLGHRLPIAVFSYSMGAAGPSSSWSPFCDYSPEWVALKAAERAGAVPLFIDLPAWHEAFAGVKNRYADRRSRAGEGIAALCDRLAVADSDALWDHLFEQPMPIEELDARLSAYFRALREDEPEGAEENAREAFMARWIAWAVADCEGRGGDVIVVCGGFHAPALERLWKEVPAGIAAQKPAVSEEAPLGQGGARSEARRSYIVPYSFYRLDSFVGYESGMPSPAYYQALWEEGPEAAGEAMLFAAIERLRRKKQLVSAADVIAASTSAQALRILRGHEALARTDVLDGLASALIKDALEAPLPWTRRGKILPRTDPMIVEIVAAFSGDRTGELARETPRPPLVLDALAEIEAAGIPYSIAAATVHVAVTDPEGLRKSRVLHRLRVLGVPGVSLVRAPLLGRGRSGAALSEVWSVKRALDADAALIEASAYGATLEAAAAGRIEELLLHAKDVGLIAGLLVEAALAGVSSLAARLLREMEQAVWSEPSFSAIGKALSHLVGLFRHDALFGVRGSAELAVVIGASFDRGLWLFEGIQGASAALPQADVTAAVALRDTLIAAEDARAEAVQNQDSRARPGEDALALVDRSRAHAVMRRRARDTGAPAALRGAALGFLWSTGFWVSLKAGEGAEAEMGEAAPAEEETIAVLRASARPSLLGDFLLGLFALAREEVQRARSLLRATDTVIAEMPERDFLVAVPSLRLAFSYLPPRERERIAALVLAIHQAPEARARSLLSLDIDPETILRGRRLDLEISEKEQRFGLAGEEGT
ncbi:MAG TPA: DUF5682 family protein [Polyangiaceae bacterium]|nr:DUF5682 family protein [Polyangiaceae bacterium]